VAYRIEFAKSDGPLELTLRAILVGIVLGALLTAANTYLGLQLGMTVSASIPAAVLSMIVLRGVLRFEDVTIQENNIVQTMASAGESLAAGIIFTVPALLVMGMDIDLLDTFIIAILGGILGTMFTITLRRVFIVEEELPYPEGVACREVLEAGERGGSGLIAILYALGLGAIYGWVVKGFRIVHSHVEGAISFAGTRLYTGFDLSLALLSVGFIVGIRIASFIFLGGFIGFVILVPLLGAIQGWPAGVGPTDSFMLLWSEHIRFVGVGAMVVGGVWTLFELRQTIRVGLSKALGAADDTENKFLDRTERDIDIRKTMIVCGIIAVATFFFYWIRIESLLLAFVGTLFLAAVSFFFSAVAGYIAGVVGSSNSPVSGMTIATIMATSLLVWLVGDLVLGLDNESLMYATLLIASIVAVNAAIAGDVMQDLKTGHLIGATPWKQQVAEIGGVVCGAVVAPITVVLLNDAFRITKTHCLTDPPGGDIAACEHALLAPQAELIGALIQGIFGGTVNTPMVTLGVVIAILLIWKGLPVMPVAIGIYLPMALSSTIMVGGILAALIGGTAILRTDGDISSEPSSNAKKMASKVTDRGVLLAAGLIAGEALMGVVVAAFIVFSNLTGGSIPMPWLWGESLGFPMGVLGSFISILFFGWFVGVFIILATRQLPDETEDCLIGSRPVFTRFLGMTLLWDWVLVSKAAIRNLIVKIKG